LSVRKKRIDPYIAEKCFSPPAITLVDRIIIPILREPLPPLISANNTSMKQAIAWYLSGVDIFVEIANY
jgi:hypothetical protein